MKAIEAGIIELREAGKSRQEIADYFGLSKKQIANWVTRYNRGRARLAHGILPRKKGRPRKDGQPPRQIEATELKRLRMENQFCGILCGSQKGSETKSKVLCHPSAPGGLPYIGHMPILWGLPKRLLRLCSPPGAARVRRRTGTVPPPCPANLRLPANVAVAGKPRHPS